MMDTSDSYTVEQAVDMLCPARSQTKDCMCIAGACMAWRWSQSKATAAFMKDAIAIAKGEDLKVADAMSEALKRNGGKYERTEGYCGLAGYPHNSVKP